jgi:xanthine/uracil permease
MGLQVIKHSMYRYHGLNRLVIYISHPLTHVIPLSTYVFLQHAFAMVGGLITPPFVVFKFTIAFGDVDQQQYAIAAALITSGICTLINCYQVPIPFSKSFYGRQLYIGSGVLSVMGTSFTFLPIFEIGIRQMKADGIDGYDAYGK